MKHASEFLNVDIISVAREKKERQKTINPLAVKLVELVFVSLYILCDGCHEKYADDDFLLATKALWADNFSRKNRTHNEIRQALIKIEDNTRWRWNPPSLSEFSELCTETAEDRGLITKEKAYKYAYEIMRNDLRDKLSEDQVSIIKHAIKESDSHFLMNNVVAKTQAVFYRNYEIAVRDYIAGKELNPINKGIENKSPETTEFRKQQEIAKDFSHLKSYEKNMPEIRRILGMNADGTTNSKRV
jgi:hypothetical protein